MVPPGLNAAEIYALPMCVGEVQAIRDEARQVAFQERQAVGAPGAQAVGPAAAVGVAALPAVAGPLCLLVRYPMPAVS